MTTVAVLVDPPREGHVLSRLRETSPLSAAEAADLYAAMTKDVVAAVADSGGDLLVNYRPDDWLDGDGDAETEVRDVVADVVEDARYEVQVGETFAGRVGNTVTHLLESEDVRTVAAVEPTAAFLTRSIVDSAAMKLRRSEAVLGPAPGGRVYYAGFRESIDFQGAYTAPPVRTLTDRGRDAGLDVDFLQMLPVVETGPDLAEALTRIRARRSAGLRVPSHTAEALDGLGLVADATDDGLDVSR